jgi:excinuclease ABC subunit B
MRISAGLEAGERYQTLLGATGTGKTATMAWGSRRSVARRSSSPTTRRSRTALQRVREFFPDNAVELRLLRLLPARGVRPTRPTSVEGQLAQRRHRPAPTRGDLEPALAPRVIIVASVSCIYGLGSPEEYEQRVVFLTVEEEHDRDLGASWSTSSTSATTRCSVAAASGEGDVLEVQPAHSETAFRISFLTTRSRRVTHFDPLTGECSRGSTRYDLPGDAVRVEADDRARSVEIQEELAAQIRRFEDANRCSRPTGSVSARSTPRDDAESASATGSRTTRGSSRAPAGSAPHTLDCFRPASSSSRTCRADDPADRGMYEGDRSRKRRWSTSASAFPRRSTTGRCADEFLAKVPQLVLVSATPGSWELRHSTRIAEQLIRPTGIVDRRSSGRRAQPTTC